MNKETKICQNCKQNFVIEDEDFSFYKKIDVPPPTFCPDCRLQRRLSFRNERSLYKRKCDLCQQDTIAIYPSDAVFPVYCHECWWSDKWDPLSYGQEYDFSKPFFEQFQVLSNRVPHFNLFQRNMQNSPYSNICGESKNIYLSYSVIHDSEDVFYSQSADHCIDVIDAFNLTNSEHCYQNVYGDKNYNSHYLVFSRNCIDSWFLFDCVNCKNCILSNNLRNKEYVVRNKSYSKDEYFEKLKQLNLGSFAAIKAMKKEFQSLSEKSLCKYARITKATIATGDNLMNVKNAKNCFNSYNVENVKYCFRTVDLKDSIDTNFTGLVSELIYEYTNGGKISSNVKFALSSSEALNNIEYADSSHSSSYLFGCIGVKNREYCILNKQYTKEEYGKLRKQIIEQMNKVPYIDKKGRVYKYGEFFPIELSPFGYNETVAHEYFILDKEESVSRGYRWQEPEIRQYEITKRSEDLPDHIKDADDAILKEIIQCSHANPASASGGAGCNEQCTTAFKIIPEELQFYRKMNLPLPRLCPNCRHYQRLKQRNPLKLWHRTCQCAGRKSEIRNSKSETFQYTNTVSHFHGNNPCPNEFETSYAPNRKEIVYCEQCYNAEVV